ncbi:alpha beta-hydrolase [Coniophora puteana RWD-64-598 SS2]|uniref:Alpha beta-hydrolase n=1 Tax=Coniophora puteana (strain RWD-64-598) TaxID=741705 RepID=R7SFP8_CONPW|nr:alpha beta-hydrolase [Coniophora puteana RWD-64-598 SS2]EIW74562.1 alpha beta-hydrolase [Coniophora puteana RWD-64-598 SS2]
MAFLCANSSGRIYTRAISCWRPSLSLQPPFHLTAPSSARCTRTTMLASEDQKDDKPQLKTTDASTIFEYTPATRRREDLLAYAYFLYETWGSSVWAIFSSWTDPSVILVSFTFSFVTSFLLLIVLLASIAIKTPTLRDLIDRVCENDDGLTVVNSAYPQIFSWMPESVRKAAYDTMNKPQFESPSRMCRRVFDLDIAKVLLVISALMYERQKPRWSGVMLRRAGTARGRGNVKVSDWYIGKIAKKLGLNYRAITEMNSGSTICGAFYSTSGSDNFIILAFKGTQPDEFGEWATDFSCNWAMGSEYLRGYGSVHRGFYQAMFPERVSASGRTPYEVIRGALKDIATEMRNGTQGSQAQDPVNVFVTGHSLGTASATMFYARALQRPEDLGADINLRDAYLFATPITASPQSRAAFNNDMQRDPDRPRNMWRITNKRDAVATGLPDLGDLALHSQNVSERSQANFCHLGQEIKMRDYYNLSVTGPGTLVPKGTAVQIVSNVKQSNKDGFPTGVVNPIELPPLLKMAENIPMIGRFVQHAPAGYLHLLSHMRPTDADETLPWYGAADAIKEIVKVES